MESPHKITDKATVGELLPQKFPFVMVDTMFDFNETSVISGLTITADNIFFDGQNFLECGLVEHMAQSVALHTGYEFFIKKEQAPTGYIGSIKEIKIGSLPKLNDQIKTTVTILHEFAGITLVEIVTTLNDDEIASGQMKTVLAK